MTIYYWQYGNKLNYHARDLTEAMDIKQQLRKKYGHSSYNGCSCFHYFINDTREWL